PPGSSKRSGTASFPREPEPRRPLAKPGCRPKRVRHGSFFKKGLSRRQYFLYSALQQQDTLGDAFGLVSPVEAAASTTLAAREPDSVRPVLPVLCADPACPGSRGGCRSQTRRVAAACRRHKDRWQPR